jgi:hypothetical protein
MFIVSTVENFPRIEGFFFTFIEAELEKKRSVFNTVRKVEDQWKLIWIATSLIADAAAAGRYRLYLPPRTTGRWFF